MPRNVITRRPRATDGPALAALLGELAYPAEDTAIPARMRHLEASENVLTLVAEHEGSVVGLVTAHALRSLHVDGEVGWITLLVVAEGARGHGIGRRLIAEAEAWLASRACTRASVTTAVKREDAHEFYSRVGYEQSGLRFSRRLGEQIPPGGMDGSGDRQRHMETH